MKSSSETTPWVIIRFVAIVEALDESCNRRAVACAASKMEEPPGMDRHAVHHGVWQV
jgi:hypothetical protein